jgi:hypothetical protein
VASHRLQTNKDSPFESGKMGMKKSVKYGLKLNSLISDMKWHPSQVYPTLDWLLHSACSEDEDKEHGDLPIR